MSPAANPTRSQLSVQIDADPARRHQGRRLLGRRPKAAIVDDALRAYLDDVPTALRAPIPGGAALSTGNRRQDAPKIGAASE
jgi:hypothetical protein